MPRCNNQFLIDEKRVGTDQASGMAELERLNRRIVELGEKGQAGRRHRRRIFWTRRTKSTARFSSSV